MAFAQDVPDEPPQGYEETIGFPDLYFDGPNHLLPGTTNTISLAGGSVEGYNLSLKVEEIKYDKEAGEVVVGKIANGWSLNGLSMTINEANFPAEHAKITITLEKNGETMDYEHYLDKIEPHEEYFDDYEYPIEILKGDSSFLINQREGTIYNEENPDGQDELFYITKAEAIDDMISVSEAEDGWNITGLKEGETKVRLTYTTFGGESATYDYPVTVLDAEYSLSTDLEDGFVELSAGESFTVTASGTRITSDGESSDGFTFEWIPDGPATVKADGNTAVITVGDDFSSDNEVSVEVKMFYDGKEVANDYIYAHADANPTEIAAIDYNKDLGLNETMTITPSLIDKATKEPLTNVTYMWEHMDGVEIFDENGTKVGYDESISCYNGSTEAQTFTVKRTSSTDTSFDLTTWWTNEEGATYIRTAKFKLNDLHEHVWDEGKVTTPATCKAEGVMTYTCECGETRTEVILPTGEHTEGTPVRENEVAETKDAVGHYEEVVYCSVCGDELSRTEKEITTLHDAKAKAMEDLAALEGKLGEYDEADRADIQKAIDDAKAAIEDAEDATSVDNAVKAAGSVMSSKKTIAQKSEEAKKAAVKKATPKENVDLPAAKIKKPKAGKKKMTVKWAKLSKKSAN